MRDLTIAVALITLLASCGGQPADHTSKKVGEHNPVPAADVGADRSTFVAAIESELEGVRKDLGELELRVANASDNAQAELRAMLVKLGEQRDVVSKKFTDFRDSVIQETAAVRREIADSCRGLRDAVKKALQSAS